ENEVDAQTEETRLPVVAACLKKAVLVDRLRILPVVEHVGKPQRQVQFPIHKGFADTHIADQHTPGFSLRNRSRSLVIHKCIPAKTCRQRKEGRKATRKRSCGTITLKA